MYVEIDHNTEEFVLLLPEEYMRFHNELKQAILTEFAFEPLNNETLEQTNSYIIEWFSQKGINLSDNST